MPKEAQFRVTDDDPNITEDSTFGTTWRDTWKFRCPQHLRILLKPGDLFSAKLYDSADVEYVAPDALVKIEVRDPSETKAIIVYGPDNYTRSGDFQDIKKRRKLQIEEPILVKPRDWIVVATKDSTGMDTASVANSFFELLTTRVVD